MALNTKEKGNIGLGRAIAYFTSLGHTVSIPLTDSQDYDLVVDMEDSLYKIQVKFTSQKARNLSNDYCVGLRSISGSSKKEYKTVIHTKVDYLFVVSEDLKCYLIPIIDIDQKAQITLNELYYEKYGVMGERSIPASC